MLNDARAAVDEAATWVAHRCSDEDLALLESARYQVVSRSATSLERLHHEADLLIRWSASLAREEASFTERL